MRIVQSGGMGGLMYRFASTMPPGLGRVFVDALRETGNMFREAPGGPDQAPERYFRVIRGLFSTTNSLTA
jgi:hypothetical protein